MKMLHEELEEPNAIQMRICQLIKVQQTREMLAENTWIHRSKVKVAFDKKIKKNEFKVNDMVLRWDARWEEKGKHGKFDHLSLQKSWIIILLLWKI